MSLTATTRMSSRGQVVIPESIRQRLKLQPGTEFVVIAQDDIVLFKKLSPPKWEEFDSLVREARRQARLSRLTPRHVKRALITVRQQ